METGRVQQRNAARPVAASGRARAVAYALFAYGCWGVFPVYFKALHQISAPVVLCHRILWSAVVMSVVVAATGRPRDVARALRSGKVLLTLAGTTLLIATNWLVYIWAVAQGHILQASLGYFINPLMSVALGALLLRERLTRLQALAVLLASCGVVAQAMSAGVPPWISVVLAITFALYGLLRKTVAIDAAGGLLAETLMLVIPALAWVIAAPRPWGAPEMGWSGPALLMAAGPITALPLLAFSMGARRLPLAAIGFLQYVSPTLQFLLGVVFYGEAFGGAQLVTFGLIWIAVVVFVMDALGTGWTRRAEARSDGARR
jgi:chloramphenicol-sensitive protein RarD